MPQKPFFENPTMPAVRRRRGPTSILSLLLFSGAFPAAVMACESSDDTPAVRDVDGDGGPGPDAGPDSRHEADARAHADGEADAAPDAPDDEDEDAGDRFEFLFQGASAMQTAVYAGCTDCNHGDEEPTATARYFFDVHVPKRLRTFADYQTGGEVDVSAASLYLLSFGSDETYLAGPKWAFGSSPKGTTLGADKLGHQTSFRFVKPEHAAWPATLGEARTFTREQIGKMFDEGAYYEDQPDGCRRYHEHNRCDDEDDFIAWPWSASYIVPGLDGDTVWDYLVQKPFVVAFETRDQASPATPARRGLAWVQLHGQVEDVSGGKRLAATGADLRIWLAD